MKKLISLLFLFGLSHLSFAQWSPVKALDDFQNRFPVEKIFLQYDKAGYIAGDDIFFKSYVFSESGLSLISTNLYLELYNHDKKLLDKLIVPLKNGAGQGSFSIKETTPEGVYFIRAYTLWSLNFGRQAPYLYSFPIYNPLSDKRLVPKPVHWTAYAYPESGSLVQGIKNKVAVRLFTNSRLPDSWKGVVREKAVQKQVAEFSSFNREIGAFEFIPEPGKSYEVNVTDNLGNQQNIALTPSKLSGALLQVSRQGNEIICNLVFKNISPITKPYQLIGQMHNQVIYHALVKRTDSVITARIPVTKLVNGILHITLFDEKHNAISERLFFIEAEPHATVAVETEKISFEKRGLNIYSFPVDSSTFGTYSVLITDSDAPAMASNFLTSFLLSSDISFSISEPSWYFDEKSLHRTQALDALLISDKWRWFNWQNLMTNRLPEIKFQPDNYLSYTGTVFLGKKMQLNKPLNLIFRHDSTVQISQAQTDSTASFTLEGMEFMDTATLYYQLDSKKAGAKAIKILFEENNKFQSWNGSLPESAFTLVPRKPSDSIPYSVKRNLQALNNQNKIDKRYLQLNEVVVRSKLKSAKEELNKKLSSSAFSSMDERIYDFSDPRQSAGGSLNILDWARGHISGLGTFPLYRNSLINVYVDEMLADQSFARSLAISDVAMVKFQSTSMRMGGGPALLIYTKRGDGGSAFFNGLPNSILKGYKRTLPFPIFDYSNDFYKSIENDTREVLYWNTNMNADSTGKMKIRFYNNDITKQYRVVIIGFTEEGKPLYTEKIISE